MMEDKIIMTRHEVMTDEVRGEKVIQEVFCLSVADVFCPCVA